MKERSFSAGTNGDGVGHGDSPHDYFGLPAHFDVDGDHRESYRAWPPGAVRFVYEGAWAQ